MAKLSQNGTLLTVLSKQFKDYAVATCQTEFSADGFDVIRLCNSHISISVHPELTGKIYEIADLADAVRFAEVDFAGPGESKTRFLTVSLKNGINTND